ncbi:GIY-YIG nuclease family protein [Pedobacter sp. HMF7647]|uniref:GIY-YIG nuclease family protein n=1 Tax=Hufsiella arboris TaxID=2695275 RepID=A0A7K1Y8X0_9SPHI|nr:exonuclease domain-containing protein [Hufsiella arboris]MXV50870.1 GIY-YIG nuclease family protein [Hufsiella arboris]
MYAIVDIETTGGHAQTNGITEIAIVLHDGVCVTERYETLVNPQIAIPPFITALTGISNDMVFNAPAWIDVAETIHKLLENKIFIAHNVNFDYSFVKFHLSKHGFDLNCKKLCTVRLGRKIFPGLSSYSLGKFAKQMGINNYSRHRAAGDADATAKLFELMLQNDTNKHIEQALKHHSKEQVLPPNLPKEQFESLPYTPGIYYFHNAKGKIIYVGKAKNIRRRVFSHFSNNSPRKQKQDFLRDIHQLSYQDCGNELISFILEEIEIKRLWPEYNRAQKRFEQQWGIFLFEDQNGYTRLAVDKKSRLTNPVLSFNQALEAYNFLSRFVEDNELCPKLCFIQRNRLECAGLISGKCHGPCCGKEQAETYNKRVEDAFRSLKLAQPTYAIIESGRMRDEKSCILVEQGKFYGLGYIQSESVMDDLELVKRSVTPYPQTEFIKNLVRSYANRFPERVVIYNTSNS